MSVVEPSILPKSYVTMDVIKEIIGQGGDDAFYVCDIQDIVLKYQVWTKLMPRVEPFYAVKCNDSPGVLSTLASLGTGFDCASKGEITKVIGMGVHHSRIIFANPSKQLSHLSNAAKCQVKLMTFDGESELYKIKKHFPDAKLVLRIRFDDNKAELCLGEKYGCDPILEAPSLLSLAQKLGIRVVGICFHVGSGSRSPSIFYKAIQASRKLFEYAEQNLGFELTLLDIGGGFPGKLGQQMEEIASSVNKALEEYFPKTSVRVIAEPGTFFVATAYTLACNIFATKTVMRNSQKRIMYFINDGVYGSFHGMHKLGVINVSPKLQRKCSTNSDTITYSSSIWGPTLDSADIISPSIMLPQMEIGDWMIFENMGAYTICTCSPFNAISLPKIYVITDDSTTILLKNSSSSQPPEINTFF